MKTRERIIGISLAVASLAVLLFAAELSIRAWHLVRWNISFFQGVPRNVGNLSPIAVDRNLGWRPTPNYRFDGERRSLDGSVYAARISQDRNGFRAFGDPASRRPKVFVVGDSFTQAVEVSDDKAYYALLEDDFEIFVYGGGGYGTLQEYLIFDQFFDLIKPDVVVWQYSTNDVVNNSPELEAASTINNNGMIRPYLVDGRIVHVLPKSFATELREFSLQYCRVCYLVLNRIDRLRARVSLNTVETETSPGERSDLVFRRAVDVTDRIMEMVKARSGGTPIVGFIVGAGEPYGPEYIESLTRISKRHGIRLIDVEPPVLLAEGQGTSVRAEDGAHWNETGHRIAGEALRRSLRLIHPARNPAADPGPVGHPE
jgi:hypothetical protein